MHHGPTAGEQEPRPFLRAGHERLMMLVNDKNGHLIVLSVSHVGDPLTGLVTPLSRLGERTPLATVVLACSAGWHRPTPRQAFNH